MQYIRTLSSGNDQDVKLHLSPHPNEISKQTNKENGESSHWGILLPTSSESSVSSIPADEQSQATTKVTIPLRCKKKKAREKENIY